MSSLVLDVSAWHFRPRVHGSIFLKKFLFVLEMAHNKQQGQFTLI